MRIIGMSPTSFVGKDGSTVTGTTFHVTEPISPDRGTGEKADKLFLSTQKLKSLDFTPTVGMEITVYYNKYAKPEKIMNNADGEIDLA